jgi:hypothetical protein
LAILRAELQDFVEYAGIKTQTVWSASPLRGCAAGKAGLDLAIARGWLVLHESGTFVRFTAAGAELFA